MKTISLEDHNKFDDLRIQQAISGLTERQSKELCELVAGQQRDSSRSDLEAGFNEFDHCVALIDVWLANRSEISLGHDQRNLLLLRFAGGSPDRTMAGAKKYAATPPAGRWFWSTLLAAAAVCVTLASVIWMNQSQSQVADTKVSADQLRKQMLANPPGDMLRWVWNPVRSDRFDNREDQFLGDVVWSDILQRGYALLHIDSPVADPALYQLFLYESLIDDSDSGVLCCEFRFDGYATPFVVMIRPESDVSEPRRFSVQRSIEEPKWTAGPNQIEEIELVAQATDAFPTNQLSEAEEGAPQQGITADETTDTF